LVIGVATSPITAEFPGMYVAIQTFMSFFQGPLFAILLLGIFWKRTTQWGGVSALIIGIASAIYMNVTKDQHFTIEDPFLYISWWSFVVGFIVNVSVSLFTKPHSEERLKGLVFSTKIMESKE
jgi:SSS family solute:Na+ symporter